MFDEKALNLCSRGIELIKKGKMKKSLNELCLTLDIVEFMANTVQIPLEKTFHFSTRTIMATSLPDSQTYRSRHR